MKPSNGWVSRAIAAVALLLMASACTDETIIYRDRELFEDPPTAALGFVGYSDEDAKLTVCGNCHVGVQSQWEETAHADAWNGLQDSGHAQSFCEGCHTTNDLGNLTEEAAGYNNVAESRYYDVQCESCHGPGLSHVNNPDASQPIASIAVGLDLTSGCGQCHSGAHHPFVEEWSESRHGFAASDYARGREACQSCHEGKGALLALGVDADYVEKGGSDLQAISCAVCHDPHGGPYTAQLRFPIDVPNVEQNLCMKCHQKRAVPDDGTSSRGPHSPQGPLLLGEDVGWEPPGFAYSNTAIVGTHGSEGNPRLCASCHVTGREITDPETGEFLITATGHSFDPIPCVDAQGVPTGEEDCADTERSFASCTTSGCHGSEDAARSARAIAQTRIANLVAELDALLAQVPEDQFSSDDDVFTSAEGAEFNAGLGDISSSAIHNPFMTEALLTASIQHIRDFYNLGAQTSVSLELQLQPGSK